MANPTDAVDPAAFVDAGCLLGLLPPTSASVAADVGDSLLFAELAADKRWSRLEQPADWYAACGDTLGKLGWRGGAFDFGYFAPRGETFTLEEVILALFAKRVNHERAALAGQTIAAFTALPEDDRRRVVFLDFAVSEHALDVLVGVGQGVELTLAGVFLRTTEDAERPFETEFQVAALEGRIATVTYTATLSEEVYGNVRETVLEKLGARRKELILTLF